MSLRVTQGDVYPPYSTYLAEPRGLKALYEGLATQPDVEVDRNIRDVLETAFEPDTTLVFAGAIPSPDPIAYLRHLEAFVRAGGRLVIAFDPIETASSSVDVMGVSLYQEEGVEIIDDETENDGPVAKTEPKGKGRFNVRGGRPIEPPETPPTDEARRRARVGPGDIGDGLDSLEADFVTQDISERWGFTYRRRPLPRREKDAVSRPLVDVARVSDDAALPPSAPWLSELYFADLDGAWTPHYRRNDVGEETAVMMERALGEGSVVVCSDSFLLSNEALRNHRHPEYLVWLLNQRSRVVFDESHLGVVSRPGIMALIRRFRLHGFILALLAAALLYVWRSASPLVPHRTWEEEQALFASTEGRDALDGLKQLIKRSVPRPQVLDTCVEVWKPSFRRDPRVQTNQGGVLELLEPRTSKTEMPEDTVRRYNAIRDALRRARR